MEKSLQKIFEGYQSFRKKYTTGDQSIMSSLSEQGQKPQIMVISCCDSRVDPALILQCDPGDLFVVRNVANIVPPYEREGAYHGTSAALEFGINFLNIKHLILLGHSQCGGIQASLKNEQDFQQNDFITNWVSIIKKPNNHIYDCDEYAKLSLHTSYQNCLSFPWIKEKVQQEKLMIHLWYFDIKSGKIFNFHQQKEQFLTLDQE